MKYQSSIKQVVSVAFLSLFLVACSGTDTKQEEAAAAAAAAAAEAKLPPRQKPPLLKQRKNVLQLKPPLIFASFRMLRAWRAMWCTLNSIVLR